VLAITLAADTSSPALAAKALRIPPELPQTTIHG
jgi:hypothetical protein